jgi:hypothetical protein
MDKGLRSSPDCEVPLQDLLKEKTVPFCCDNRNVTLAVFRNGKAGQFSKAIQLELRILGPISGNGNSCNTSFVIDLSYFMRSM